LRFVIAQFEVVIDNAADLAGILTVYQALTAIRKDCGHIGKKHWRIWRPKADIHSNSLQ